MVAVVERNLLNRHLVQVSGGGRRQVRELRRKKIDETPHRRDEAATRREYRLDEPRRCAPVRKHRLQPARSNIIEDQHFRKLDHADAGQRRVAQGRHVVGYEARLVQHRGEAAVRTFEMPGVLAIRRAEIEAWKQRQVARNCRARPALEQLRAGDD